MIPPNLLPADLRPPGASPSRIARCERDAGVMFPEDYRAFLMRSDGYEGPVGRGYLSLWRVADLSADNSGYALGPDMSGVFYIGSNGGPTAYGIDRSGGRPVYVSVPFVPGERRDVRILGTSFRAFVEAVAAGEGW